jgi:RNA polymerase sigma factor (sigma-70 family)
VENRDEIDPTQDAYRRYLFSRDDKDFEKAVQLITPYLFGYASYLNKGNAANEIDSIVQETLIEFARTSINKNEYIINIRSFLYTVLRRRSADSLRKKGREFRKRADIESIPEPVDPRPNHQVDQYESLLDLVLREINEMPDPNGEILRLHLFDELNAIEIATKLKLELNSIRGKLHRGKTALQECIKNAGWTLNPLETLEMNRRRNGREE